MQVKREKLAGKGCSHVKKHAKKQLLSGCKMFKDPSGIKDNSLIFSTQPMSFHGGFGEKMKHKPAELKPLVFAVLRGNYTYFSVEKKNRSLNISYLDIYEFILLTYSTGSFYISS